MDSSVIEEIAKQLGMAVDQTGQFITEHLPEFAAMKAMQAAVPLVLWASLAVISLCVMVGSWLVLRKNIEREEERFNADRESADPKDRYRIYKDDYGTKVGEYTSFYVVIGAFIVFLCFLFMLICAVFFSVPEVIGWTNYPEAMLIDMALNAM